MIKRALFLVLLGIFLGPAQVWGDAPIRVKEARDVDPWLRRELAREFRFRCENLTLGQFIDRLNADLRDGILIDPVQWKSDPKVLKEGCFTWPISRETSLGGLLEAASKDLAFRWKASGDSIFLLPAVKGDFGILRRNIDVHTLRDQWGTMDDVTRAAAADLLDEESGRSHADFLIAALKAEKGPTDLRRRLAAALGRIGGAETVASLRAILMTETHDDLVLCRYAAGALGRIGDGAATEALLSVLASAKDAGARRCAAGALRHVGGPAAIDALFACFLGDPDPMVWGAASGSLGRIGGKGVVRRLEEIRAGNPDPKRRQAAASALERTGITKGSTGR